MKLARLLLVPLFAVLAFGCGPDPKPTAFESKHDEKGHGHSHEHNKMMLEDFGPYHAGLTAHLSSKEGNEVDVVFETLEHKPVPIAADKLTGTAVKNGEDQKHQLVFEPAPKDERKDDPDGKCSRFTAKTPWMKPDDTYTITVTAPLNGKDKPIPFVDFNPRKFAHVDE